MKATGRRESRRTGGKAGAARAGGGWSLRSALPGLILAGLVVAVYFPAVFAGFIWDDLSGIKDNYLLRSWKGLWTLWFDPFRARIGHYFPLTYTTFWFEYRVWGPSPAGYHVVNILLQAVDSALLYYLLRRMRVPGAWMAAALFAIHPVQVASVAWAIERKNVLCGLFYLLSFWAWLGREDRGWRAVALSLAFFVCAMLSKSIAVTFPVALLLYEWWKTGRIGKKVAVQVAPFFVLGAGLAALEMLTHLRTEPDRGLSLVDKGLIAGRALWFYAGKLFWPVNLMAVYPQWKIDPRQAWQWLFPVGAAAVLGGLWAARRRVGRGAFAGAAFYAVTLSPILGFVQYSIMNYSYVHDHHQYLACIGVFALVAAGLDGVSRRYWEGNGRRRGASNGVLCAMVLAPLAVLSWRQTLLYKDLETLFRDNLKRNPAAWPACQNVGTAALAKGNLDEAERMFRKALELRGQGDQFHNLAVAVNRRNRPQEALVYADKALERVPDKPVYLVDKGRILAHLGEFPEACAVFRKCLALDPLNSEARVNLGGALIEMRKMEEGKAVLGEVLRDEPKNAQAHASLGLALLYEKKTGEAVAQLREAVRLDPDQFEPANNLAWVLAASSDASLRNPAEAVGLAEKACKLIGYEDAGFLDTLAVAYGAAGRFAEAVRTEEKALGVARAAGKSDLCAELEKRLALFRENRPFVE